MDALANNGIKLERHYVYKYCSPTRSAFMSGRLPVHVNQNNACNDALSASGIDLRMTILPQKFKLANWTTAMTGKWHCGARSVANLPTSRGFDYHLGFLKGGEDHWQQNRCAGGPDASTVDLWGSDTPAWGANGTYSAHLYASAAVAVVHNFSRALAAGQTQGLFLYLPWHDTHTPLEAPDEYFYPPHAGYTDFGPRVTYNAMARVLDEGMGNVTGAIKAQGLWDATLIVFSADNGGWLLKGGNGGSSNYPLRGGKVTDFEGGVRAVSFIGGGYLPDAVRGTSHSGYISIADWYATFCFLVGVEPGDAVANATVPTTDSLNVWPSLLIPNSRTTPRTRILLSYCPDPEVNKCTANNSALIVGAYKIICGAQEGMGYHQFPGFPNSTATPTATIDCAAACCLFNIIDDPTEREDLRVSKPAIFANMTAELAAEAKTVFQTNYPEPGTDECLSYAQGKSYYRGFIGPLCFAKSPMPPSPPPKPFALKRGGDCLVGSGASAVAQPCTSTAADRVWTVPVYGPGMAIVGTAGPRYLKVDEQPRGNVTTKAGFCTRGDVHLDPDAGQGKTAQGFVLDEATGQIRSTYCVGFGCLAVPGNGSFAHTSHCTAGSGGWRQDFGSSAPHGWTDGLGDTT